MSERLGWILFFFIVGAIVGLLIVEAWKMRRLRSRQVIVCLCGHDRRSHRGGFCDQCTCFFWEPRVKLVTCEEIVERASKRRIFG